MRRSAQPTNYELTELTRDLDAATENSADGGVSLAFPEGGQEAWTCLLGSSLMMFPSFGFQTAGKKIHRYCVGLIMKMAINTVQLDRSRITLAPTNSPTIAFVTWVGSLQYLSS